METTLAAPEPVVLPYGEAVSLWQIRSSEKIQLEGLQEMLRVACCCDTPMGEVVGLDGRAFVGPMAAIA
ncbi:hypothetical protein GJ744_002774 [Endocarpon pusillum]|uniref:Uncharacterized protein n=1 Tax=Endocarpon pusillum TaxID=364733 RepID=A0A8H7AS68_9EURO|nr:hypothetical protein GJ744_002774 [Endocarpon pusillum]